MQEIILKKLKNEIRQLLCSLKIILKKLKNEIRQLLCSLYR